MSENPSAADNAVLEALLQQLTLQRDAYLETSSKIETLLTQHIASRKGRTLSTGSLGNPSSVREVLQKPPRSPRLSVTKVHTDPVGGRDLHRRVSSIGPSTFVSDTDSRWTGNSDDETDEDLYVSKPLEPQEYDHEDFREHLRNYDWEDPAKQILKTIIDNEARMGWKYLFPVDKKVSRDRSHFTHCQVFDVGADGAPVPTYDSRNEEVTSRATAVWNTVKSVNPPSKETKAVGRITILREPSPILFGAIHFTHCQILDTDELFERLVDSSTSCARLHRAFDKDPRRQSSFVFSFEYFTIIGDDCQPMSWQESDKQTKRKPQHIPITRCSAVVALSLSSQPIRKIRNPSRRAETAYGFVYDTWAPWQVLNLQSFADWKASTDTHDSTKHYVNGVEAFMTTLLAEFADAELRFEHIYREISTLITPPTEFMFNAEIRDRLLFEDSEFTYSRRYFWAYQTCGIMIDSLKSLIDAYEDTFTDDVWEGNHKSLWPLIDQDSPRNKYFKKRMAVLRKKIETEIGKLRKLMGEFHDRRRDITGLRDQLFSGTSVLESRKSVDMAETTVQQGYNIKLLTLVSIFFLPLTFVTSVFGMTSLPESHFFEKFAIATVTICVPFFVLVGSLNSRRVMSFWLTRVKGWTRSLGRFAKRLDRKKRRVQETVEDTENKGDMDQETSDLEDSEQTFEPQPVVKMNTIQIAEQERVVENRWRFRGSVADQGSQHSV